MKKFLSMCCAAITAFAICVPVSAASITPQNPLQKPEANVQKQAYFAPDGMINFASKSKAVSSGCVTSYVDVVSCHFTQGVFYVWYDVKASIPAGANVAIVLRYPSATRMPSQSVGVSSKPGRYLASFSGCDNIVAKQISLTLSARDYHETSVIMTYYPSTASQYSYKTITAYEAVGSRVITMVLPYVSMVLFPESKLIQLACNAITVGGIAYNIADSVNLTKSLPLPKVGQYYEVRTWVINNRIWVQTKVWASKSLYDKGETPMYDSGSYVAYYLPDFA